MDKIFTSVLVNDLNDKLTQSTTCSGNRVKRAVQTFYVPTENLGNGSKQLRLKQKKKNRKTFDVTANGQWRSYYVILNINISRQELSRKNKYV